MLICENCMQINCFSTRLLSVYTSVTEILDNYQLIILIVYESGNFFFTQLNSLIYIIHIVNF